MSALAIFYSIFEVPVNIAFQVNILQPYVFFIVEIIIIAIFAGDILIAFNLPYFDTASRSLVITRWCIAENYLRTYFLTDLISTIPFSFISDSAYENR